MILVISFNYSFCCSTLNYRHHNSTSSAVLVCCLPMVMMAKTEASTEIEIVCTVPKLFGSLYKQ